MRYLGSKTLLLGEIEKIIKEYNGSGVFCDPFGGIGTVGNYMKKIGFSVITGDILNFAHCFKVALIENNGDECFFKLKKF
ncbi:MAG: DNA adenine methylase [Lachnospira sp.]|nr:DNA adenine methylase [Lachnospira sp.]